MVVVVVGKRRKYFIFYFFGCGSGRSKQESVASLGLYIVFFFILPTYIFHRLVVVASGSYAVVVALSPCHPYFSGVKATSVPNIAAQDATMAAFSSKQHLISTQ